MQLAQQFSFTRKAGSSTRLPMITTTLGRGSCYFYPGGQSVHRVIKGYHVVVTTIPAVGGGLPPSYQLCAPDADGLSIFIAINATHPVQAPATIFRNLKLLGTNPANWSTQPIG